MFKFNNNHIFTGFLKQKLSSVNIPTCKIYTKEFADYFERTGKEDPRVVESTDGVVYKDADKRSAVRVNYLKGNEVFNYYNDRLNASKYGGSWRRANSLFYDSGSNIPGLTKVLHSPGISYDTKTHEYLGEYLRFLRDYHDVDLMSMYNCFSDSRCNNLFIRFPYENKTVEFSSYDKKYMIYSIPVKLFANYTIAIDCGLGVEIFCGLYGDHLYDPDPKAGVNKDKQLGTRTYLKTGRLSFNQPILYNKLNVDNWKYDRELKKVTSAEQQETTILDNLTISRWDIINREQDLRMFIKVPVSCKSSIVVLEGDYRTYNDYTYLPNTDKNVIMTGCAVGNHVEVKGDESVTVTGYQESAWMFDRLHEYKLDGEAASEEAAGTEAKVAGLVGFIKSRMDPAESIEVRNLWTQGEYTKPQYDEDKKCCLISTAAELAYVVYENGKTIVTDSTGKNIEVRKYMLTDDIFINDPSAIDWKNGGLKSGVKDYVIRNWFCVQKPADNSAPGFCGIIDGQGFIIYGLYANSSFSGIDMTGLIPMIESNKTTVLKHIGLDYAYLYSSYARAFVGGTTYSAGNDVWKYKQNHCVINFGDHEDIAKRKLNPNNGPFKPISRLQLLAFNTGESYPFADRLVEYLSGSAITPMDPIKDNIKRAQKVMRQNGYRFRVDGLWEDKMQKIIYDYIMSSGPVITEVVENNAKDPEYRLRDSHRGYHTSLGHTSKSQVYDITGFVDRDAEKWYASVKKKGSKVVVDQTIMNADIYDGLYDI
jgi:hypothetical protein